MQDKLFFLSLLKKSRSAYIFLSQYIPCPSITTLNSVLADIPLIPGYTKSIFKYLKQLTTGITDDREKYVACIWDEISLAPGVIYDPNRECVVCFEDWGHKRNHKFGNHAITFYLRCLKSGNKMPLGYGFCENGTKMHQLMRCIKEFLTNLIECGLIPIVTICDQSATNVATINALIKETKLCTTRSAYRSKYHYYIIK